MEDGYLKVATRQSGASEKFCMRNRLLLYLLVHLLAGRGPGNPYKITQTNDLHRSPIPKYRFRA